MSLQVWLPLNGNLNNQGLSDVTVINNGATVDSNGKIGSCYSFDGNDDFISLTSSSLYSIIKGGSLPFSIAMWVYRADTTRAILFGDYTLSGSIDFNLEFTTSNKVRFYWRADPDLVFDNAVVATSKWSHIAVTYDGSAIKCYINGVLTQSSIVTLVTRDKTSGSYYLGGDARTGTTAFNGKMNDFRVYDHCLSAKEVKEISKGLVCHYKLDNKGFGNPNLFFNSHFDSRYTVSDWDTSKNGSLCANNWGGYNGGVGNPSTVYHAHLQEHEGDYVYNYHKTSNEDWLGISQSVVTSVEVNKTYTFSCELKRISGKNFANGGLYTKANSSTTDYTFVNWFEFPEFTSVTDNKWHKYSYTFTIDSSVYMMNGASWYIYGHSWEDGEFLMRRPKLEEGSSATEWIPHTSDSLYTSLGFDSPTEVDCSGYRNDGNKVGNVLPSEPSGRYNISTYCNSTNIGTNTPEGAAFIKCALVNPVMNATALTINWWGNIEDYSLQDSGILSLSNDPSYPSDYETSALAQYDSRFRFNLVDGSDSSISSLSLIETGNWHMYTLVFNNGIVQGYRDGVLVTSNSKSGTLAQFSYIYMGINVAGGAYRKTKSKWSDFRIYATALSASDIKELYNTSASIDKNGNMYAYEFKEE